MYYKTTLLTSDILSITIDVDGEEKMSTKQRLSDKIADIILSMITVENKYRPGDKLPNEIQLSKQLGVSRITLREAIRILVAGDVLEIRRGKGTFVREDFRGRYNPEFESVFEAKVDINDLYEMRLIFEPEAAYYAAIRATDNEIDRIVSIGREIERLITEEKDYTREESAFHRSIAKATHNEFMGRLEPVLQEAIKKGVYLYETEDLALEDVIIDHGIIMRFLQARNPDGARSAMKMHILHAIEQLNLEK